MYPEWKVCFKGQGVFAANTKPSYHQFSTNAKPSKHDLCGDSLDYVDADWDNKSS